MYVFETQIHAFLLSELLRKSTDVTAVRLGISLFISILLQEYHWILWIILSVIESVTGVIFFVWRDHATSDWQHCHDADRLRGDCDSSDSHWEVRRAGWDAEPNSFGQWAKYPFQSRLAISRPSLVMIVQHLTLSSILIETLWCNVVKWCDVACICDWLIVGLLSCNPSTISTLPQWHIMFLVSFSVN